MQEPRLNVAGPERAPEERERRREERIRMLQAAWDVALVELFRDRQAA